MIDLFIVGMASEAQSFRGEPYLTVKQMKSKQQYISQSAPKKLKKPKKITQTEKNFCIKPDPASYTPSYSKEQQQLVYIVSYIL